MIEDQPPPKATSLRPCWEMVIEDMTRVEVPVGFVVTAVDLVIEDMMERDSIGRQRYGVPLTADNGRDQLVDAYQEALDFAVYLRAFLEENKDHDRVLARLSVNAIRKVYDDHLQNLIAFRDVIETRQVAGGRGVR